MGGDAMIDVRLRLMQLMDERGLNIYSLAKRSNISWNTIKNIFSRSTNPTVTTLSMICDGLGITLAQFFEEESDTAHLSAEQQHLLNRWDQLSEKEQQAVGNMIDIILQLHQYSCISNNSLRNLHSQKIARLPVRSSARISISSCLRLTGLLPHHLPILKGTKGSFLALAMRTMYC